MKGENSFKALGELIRQEEQEEKHTTHVIFDRPWRNADRAERRACRSALYRLLHAVHGDFEGVRDPFEGGQHIRKMSSEDQEKCQNIIHFLDKMYVDIPKAVMEWSSGLPADRTDEFYHRALATDPLIGAIQKHLHDLETAIVLAPAVKKVKAKAEITAEEHYTVGLTAYIEDDAETMVAAWKSAVEKGHPEAAFRLYMHWADSGKAPEGREEALGFLENACSNKFPSALKQAMALYREDNTTIIPSLQKRMEALAKALEATAAAPLNNEALLADLESREQTRRTQSANRISARAIEISNTIKNNFTGIAHSRLTTDISQIVPTIDFKITLCAADGLSAEAQTRKQLVWFNTIGIAAVETAPNVVQTEKMTAGALELAYERAKQECMKQLDITGVLTKVMSHTVSGSMSEPHTKLDRTVSHSDPTLTYSFTLSATAGHSLTELKNRQAAWFSSIGITTEEITENTFQIKAPYSVFKRASEQAVQHIAAYRLGLPRNNVIIGTSVPPTIQPMKAPDGNAKAPPPRSHK